MALDAEVRTICFDCAKENGAAWPEGYEATWWIGLCDACSKITGVCDVSDWNWPRGRKPPTFSLINRD